MKQISYKKTKSYYCRTLTYSDLFISKSRISAGWVLKNMDKVAVLCARKVQKGIWATVAVNRIDFINPLLVKEQLEIIGHAVSVGTTSTTIYIEVFGINLESDSKRTICKGFFVMVYLDKELRPKALSNKVELTNHTLENKLNSFLLHRKKYNELLESNKTITVNKNYTDTVNDNKKTKILSSDTIVQEVDYILPRDLNPNDTAFGGDILNWMAETANNAGRKFTKNNTLVEAALNFITFKTPIYCRDEVFMLANVNYANIRAFEVTVTVMVSSPNKPEEKRIANTGHFTLVSLDDIGKPEIVPGLILDDLDDIKNFEAGKERFEFWKNIN